MSVRMKMTSLVQTEDVNLPRKLEASQLQVIYGIDKHTMELEAIVRLCDEAGETMGFFTYTLEEFGRFLENSKTGISTLAKRAGN